MTLPFRRTSASPWRASPSAAPLRRTSAPIRRASAVPPRRARVLALLAAASLLALGACGPERGLRVEDVGDSSPTAFEQPGASSGSPDEPFSLDEIRTAIEDSSGRAVTGEAPEAVSVVADCESCLEFARPFTGDDRKFQVATVANPKQRSETIAVAVVGEAEGSPRLELIATGNQLTLTPGRNGTLVVQEAMYADGDESCCPSGWSVQVFRLHDGRFEPGQRFTRLNGET
ncbi:hypothetical protein DFO66_102187 [Brevibacterium sanguinis]|uniref:LppP/LprE lipoprotein n=2 Tax=Brevibacterium TaxID=1696 RepID=A0A366IP25_9MICO|nr:MULTISPECIES: hypothetical protein [Brevibacterium]RBP67134.1 hypothetical protein DFO66_102187 [Brevibacterium sanguinis]RBP73659.1 hypothetical protein DFO65_102187 [Brevibacterium celere]